MAKKSKKSKKTYTGKAPVDHKRLAKKGKGAMGTYDEDTGGGTPMGEHQPGHPLGGRGTWTDNYQKEPKRESSQPRTEDGKFTYNAVNGKTLKDVSKSHGKSRGHTIPPTLTGGVNGIDEHDKDYRTTFYRKGDVVIRNGVKYEYLEDYVVGMKEYTGKDLREKLGITTLKEEAFRDHPDVLSGQKTAGQMVEEKKEELRKALRKTLDDSSFAATSVSEDKLFKSKRGKDTQTEAAARKIYQKNAAKGDTTPIVGYKVEEQQAPKAKSPTGESANTLLGGEAGATSKKDENVPTENKDMFSDIDAIKSRLGTTEVNEVIAAISKVLPQHAGKSDDEKFDIFIRSAKNHIQKYRQKYPNSKDSDQSIFDDFIDLLKQAASKK